MPVWPSPIVTTADSASAASAAASASASASASGTATSLTQRASQEHAQRVGHDAPIVAEAPAIWSLIGEHTDHIGGVVVCSTASLSAAVALSPRTDDIVDVHVIAMTANGTYSSHEDSMSTGVVAERASQYQHTPEALQESSIAMRLGGIMWSMIHRQLLSRETGGMDITVVTNIPDGAGLGRDTAIESATALGLACLTGVEGLDDAPLRARLADITAHSATIFSHLVPVRAHYHAALRAPAGPSVCVKDFADGSLTQATSPDNSAADVVAFSVAGPQLTDNQLEVLRQRNKFVDSVCHAFGSESLRLLPDAETRAVEWLRAVHKVRGGDADLPSPEQASEWLAFYQAETQRALSLVKVLRSRREEDIASVINESHHDMTTRYCLTGGSTIAELARARGAVSARSADAATDNAAIALVPRQLADNFAHDLAADGLTVVPLLPGAAATVFDPRGIA